MFLIHDAHPAVASAASAPVARPQTLDRVLPNSPSYTVGRPLRFGAAQRGVVGIAALVMIADCGSLVEALEQTGIVVVRSGVIPNESGIPVAVAAPAKTPTGADAVASAATDSDDAVIAPDTMRDPDHLQYASLVE